MTDEDERFLEQLSRGPAGLFIGQRHLALGSSRDPLIDLITRKYDVREPAARPYDILFDAASITGQDAFLDWLDTKVRSLALPEQVDVLGQYGWAGVWSSAIDPLWADSFESWWREVQKVFSEAYRPPDPRNRRRLHCTYLFGCTNRTEPQERPPLTRLEYLRRRTVAQSLSRRIPDTLGPIGTLAIEAYGLDDWFSIEDLIGLVAQMQPRQCHLFSASEAHVAVPEMSELASSSLVVVHESSLAQVLADGSRSGLVALGVPAEEGDLQRLVSFGGRTVSVPRDLWVSLSSTAHLLDEATLSEPSPLSMDARYGRFRQFLGAAEGRPDWEGLARGYAFSRDFEGNLEQRVQVSTGQRRLPDRPVILHGATGTGKTTALASLAFRLARSRQYPVIFIDRRAGFAAQDAVDRLCQWAEDEGAPSSVVIWDGMFELAVPSWLRHSEVA
jgi:hypothetical protein